MPLAPGDRVGQYEVRGVIGAGGMGEVYRAHDSRLGRDVAIKVLPPLFASDPERLARFDREARTLAALNHPHIAQVYGLEQSGTSSALVMELVEGEDLAQAIARGPLPVADALAIARQIVDALEAAHELGIVHRDLKPANIKLRSDGAVKVLDFGLAKGGGPVDAGGPAEAGPYVPDLTASPTMTSPAMTQAGMLLGTAAYMSPEQAKGKVVDKRADIWAFGCVFYEMVTGRLAFPGDDVTDTIVAILSRDPDWSALPAATPAPVRRLLARCLTKDVRLRLRDIGDARPDLSDEAPVATEAVRRRSPVWLGLAMAGAGVALGLLLAMLGLSWFAGRRQAPVTRFSIVAPATAPIALDPYSNEAEIAIAANGSRIVYTAPGGPQGGRLIVRSVDRFETTELAGLGTIAGGPFLSPDGEWIGYHQSGGRGRDSFALARVRASGGAPEVITPIVGPLRGASWSTDDEIVYATSFTASGLLRTRAAAGSKEEILTRPNIGEGEVDHYWPHPLPDGRHVLFTIRRRTGESDIALLALETRTWRTLIKGGSAARFLTTGHIVYASPGRLNIAGFDLKTLSLTTPARQVIGGVVTKTDGAADYDVADNGTLIYVPGGVTAAAERFSWATRSSAAVPLAIAPGNYQSSALSPDGRSIAMAVGEDAGSVILIADLARDTVARLTPPGLSAMTPVWSRDGEWVAFSAQPSGGESAGIFRVRATGAEPPERVTSATAGTQFLDSWSPDGQHLFYVLPGPSPDEGPSIRRVTFNRSGIEDALVSEWTADPRISPNGRWLAHTNIRAFPRREIEIRPFPNWNASRVVVGPGQDPRWRNDGREIYYDDGGTIFAASVDDSNGLQVGKPRKLFEGLGRLVDVASDGRFLFLDRPPSAEHPRATELRLVFNWFEELKQLNTR